MGKWSSVRSGDRLHSYALGAALVVVILVVVFVQRPTGTSGSDPAPEQGAPTDVATSTSPPSATSEDFCAEFRRFAESQAQFAGSDGTGADQLEESADALVGVGVPSDMSLPARSGYLTLIGGVYESIGLELDPAAVGAPASPVDGGDAAFTQFLTQHCPA